MMGITRGFSTLVGAAVAGFLIWLAVQIGTQTPAEYWGAYGLIAAAGLTMALSQIAGGWTKWGAPRLSPGVFLFGFLPVLVVGGWVLLARQPADFFNTSNWSRDAGIMGPVGDLGEALAAISFLIGLTLGLVFDTTGARREVADERYARERGVPAAGAGAVQRERVQRTPEGESVPARETVPAARMHHEEHGDGRRERVTDADERTAADEPLTAERHEHAGHEAEETEHRGRRFGFRRRAGSGHREDA
jgi:hypothetical protein